MEGADNRRWDELIPDALGLIFSNLSLQEKLTVVPRVCKSWSSVVMGPYCWQEIDIEEWCHRSGHSNIERMLRMLVTRSSGALRKLCVSGLHNDLSFSFIMDNACSLQRLELPGCYMNDTIMEKVAERLTTITFLDLSYCNRVGALGLETIGKHCKLLAGLRRNMHPLLNIDGKLSQNDEALAIATTMPKLKHLEIAYFRIDTESILEIISNCLELEFLDLRGCWDVKLDSKYLKDKLPYLNVLGPNIVDNYERNGSEGCSDSSDSFYDYYDESFDWEMEESLMEELELRVFQGLGHDFGHGWPPSP